MAIRTPLTLAFLACLAHPVPSSSAADDVPNTLPNTAKLTLSQPLDVLMVDGIDRFARRELVLSRNNRNAHGPIDFGRPAAHDASVSKLRDRLRTITGAVDQRVKVDAFELVASTKFDSRIAKGDTYTVHAVRWRVLPGVTAEGILLQPDSPPKARVIALPDADWTPEAFAGLAEVLNEPGVPSAAQIPRRLAENGIQVIVPTLISRDDTWSGNQAVRYTNQPHREFIYRMAYELGRHVIGYEMQKVLAAVDVFSGMNRADGRELPIGVVGVSEGGLLALFSAAVDPRIHSVMVSGYFQHRERVWQEPIYRNVWSQLIDLGDAEIAALIVPRSLVIEAAAVPPVSGPRAPYDTHYGGAAPGEITTADPDKVHGEFKHLTEIVPAGFRPLLSFVESAGGTGPAGSNAALTAFFQDLGIGGGWRSDAGPPKSIRPLSDAGERQHRQVDELVDFTQKLLEQSAKVREQLWSKLERGSVEAWTKSAEKKRAEVWRTLFGKLPEPTMPPNVRSRKILDDAAFTGYEVLLDVYPDVVAGGILLLPKDLKPGEKRPVVVCQHGLEGVSMDTIRTTGEAYKYYKAFAAELAKRGFITYAPQNPYRGMDRFRTLQRKSNPLGRSLFSYIIPQHQRTVEWLSTLPNVDRNRIAFYGLSYGGKTAVRVPPMLPQYALSICSADFNEWVRKNASSSDQYSYVFTPEYEMFEWNMGHVANYAELASLMAPRPFMVERGHEDGVAPDEWVAWEYSKVRRHYDKLGLGDRTEIEFFNGPHTIHGKGTFAFLHKQLKWPERSR